MAKTGILNLKTVMDNSDPITKIKQIQETLAKLKLPKTLSQDFTNIFSELTKSFESFQEKMSVKGKNKDFKGISADLTNIDKLLTQLKSKNEELTSGTNLKNIFKEMDYTEVKEASKAVDNLQQKLTRKIGVENIQNVRAEIEKLHQVSKSKEIDKFYEAFKTGDIEGATASLEKLYSVQSRFSEEKRPTFVAGLDQLKTALATITSNGDLPKIKSDLEAANRELNKVRSDKQRELGNTVRQTSAAIEEQTEDLQRQSKVSREAAENQKNLGSEIDTLKNRVKYFFGLTNGVLLFRRAVQSAFNTIKELDAAMTETAVVTDFSVGDMWDKLPEYTANANALGVSTKDMINAATLYYVDSTLAPKWA